MSDIPKDVAVYQAILDTGNSFQFTNIIAQTGDLMFVSALFEGVQQSSSLIVVSEQPEIILPLVLYGATNDPGAVTLIRARQVLDFRGTDAVQVIARNFYRNSGDRFFVSTQTTGDGRPISITVPLPIGTSGIAFDDSQRFKVGGTTIAPVIRDTRAVRPGEVHEVIASYQVQYQRGATIDQDYPYSTERIEILIPEDVHVKLTAAEVVGSRSGATPRPLKISETANTSLNPQRRYLEYVFEFTPPLEAGDRFVYTIEGSTPRTLTATPKTGDPMLRAPGPLNLFLIFSALLIAFGALVAGMVILRRVFRAGR